MLDELPNDVDMTKITPPYVFKYNGKVPEDWGVTGIVLIAESHISIHTFADKNFVTFDLYSCRNFAKEKVIERLVATFKPKSYEEQVIHRGQHFVRNSAD